MCKKFTQTHTTKHCPQPGGKPSTLSADLAGNCARLATVASAPLLLKVISLGQARVFTENGISQEIFSARKQFRCHSVLCPTNYTLRLLTPVLATLLLHKFFRKKEATQVRKFMAKIVPFTVQMLSYTSCGDNDEISLAQGHQENLSWLALVRPCKKCRFCNFAHKCRSILGYRHLTAAILKATFLNDITGNHCQQYWPWQTVPVQHFHQDINKEPY